MLEAISDLTVERILLSLLVISLIWTPASLLRYLLPKDSDLDWPLESGMPANSPQVGSAQYDMSDDETKQNDEESSLDDDTPVRIKGKMLRQQDFYYPGLVNAAGNLCFLNATLQSMASLGSLISYLEELPELPISSSLSQVLHALNTPSKSPPYSLRPIVLARALANSNSHRRQLLSSGEQQDAHELWGMIREGIEEEVTKHTLQAKNKIQNAGLLDLFMLPAMGVFKLPSQTSLVSRQDPFQFLMSQSIKCLVCGYTRDVRHNWESQLSLIVPPLLTCSLPTLIEESVKPELISEYNCRKCTLLLTRNKLSAQRDRLEAPPIEGNGNADTKPTSSRKQRKRKVQKLLKLVEDCIDSGDYERELPEEIKTERSVRSAGKKIAFGRTPQVLTIHLNRSSMYGHGAAYKNPCVVQIPETLDLEPYSEFSNTASEKSRDTYRLISMVVHYGSHSFGHYVAFRRRPANGPPGPDWYRISDETVTPATIDQVLASNPFLLFYERVSRASTNVGMGLVVERKDLCLQK